jgi:hypothetical protein
MSARQQRRRPPPRRAAARRASPTARAPKGGGRWILVAVGLIGVLVAWRVVSAVVGGDEELPSGTAPRTTATPTEVAADFPLPAIGTRLELKILGLGDDPKRCTAVGLQVGDDQRTVYHHLCGRGAEEESDVYFFLVRIVNHSPTAQPIALRNLEITTEGGETRPALDVESAGATRAHYFPERVELGPDSRVKAFVAFDGSPGFTPARLTYADGTQALVVHLRGTWVGAG